MTWDMVQKLQKRVNELEIALDDARIDMLRAIDAHELFHDDNVAPILERAVEKAEKALEGR